MEQLTNFRQHSAEWLEDLFDHAHDLIQIVALDGTLLYVNKSWSTLLGYDNNELQGKNILNFIEEEDRERYHEYRTRNIMGQIADVPIVFKLKAKNGKTFSVEGVVSVKQKEGVPFYTRGIFRDISLRLQNESKLQHLNEELKEREKNLEQLLIHAPDAVIVIDQQSRVLFWNPKATTLFGWQLEEVLNQDLSSIIIPPQYREAHNRGMERYLNTGVARVLNKTIEITGLKRTGEEFYVALTISNTMQGGEPVFIAFIRDITIQKENQQELERKTRLLEQSNAHLEEFAHAASHDMKEPLRKIRTFADMLKNTANERLTEDEGRMLERIELSAQRMQLLVDDLLEFSHVSDQQQGLEAVNLGEKIKKILIDLELSIEEKQARVIATDLPTVHGNRRQLQQLFHNLISNALKYNKPGVPPIIYINAQLIKGADASINAPGADKEKYYHLFEVRDNGIGFEQRYANQIFEMFKRLHGKTEYPGTGVGLAIARKVVQNHNGYIWAEGQPGDGASFRILLPVD